MTKISHPNSLKTAWKLAKSLRLCLELSWNPMNVWKLAEKEKFIFSFTQNTFLFHFRSRSHKRKEDEKRKKRETSLFFRENVLFYFTNCLKTSLISYIRCFVRRNNLISFWCFERKLNFLQKSIKIMWRKLF